MTAHGGSLAITDVARHYGRVRAVDGVSLDVPEGEFLTLLGPSGSGKTTLLMMVAGFTEPTHGTIALAGSDLTRLPPERRSFGMVFQGYALFPHLSVFENVAFPLRIRKKPEEEIRREVARALSLVRLEGYDARMPKQLSGGQQQRVAIARALSFRPKILLLDEPLGALDRKLRAELQWEIKRIHRETGATFLYVTHDQEEALSLSDRIAIFQAGKLAQVGPPQELYERPKSRFVADFLGESNFLRDGDRLYAIRPERLSLSHDAPDPALPQRPCRVVSWRYLGSAAMIDVEAERFGEVRVSVPASAAAGLCAEGTPLFVSWTADAAMPVIDDTNEA